MALKKGMYVRCPNDRDLNNPREFLLGQISELDPYGFSAKVRFWDPWEMREYYGPLVPETRQLRPAQLVHCQLFKDSRIKYQHQEYRIVDHAGTKDGLIYYLIENTQTKEVLTICEKEIIASFNNGQISPIHQLRSYELQNPRWFQIRYLVLNRMAALDRVMYGFQSLVGAKINLLPHQLNVISRCLSEIPMRFMLADEVGMGKTVEALSIMKIFLEDRSSQKILIVVPDTLKEQWRNEMLVKYGILAGMDQNKNKIRLVSVDELSFLDFISAYDLVIVDEVHKLVQDSSLFLKLLSLSRNAENLLILSATPVKHKPEEYLKLLQLLSPDVYESVTPEQLKRSLNDQEQIISRTTLLIDDFQEYLEVKADEGDEEEIEDLQDEILENTERISRIIQDPVLTKMVQKINFDNSAQAEKIIQLAITYITEVYQIENRIIRNRRKLLKATGQDYNLAQRHFIGLPYSIFEGQRTTPEEEVYTELAQMAEQIRLEPNSQSSNEFFKLVQAFFSSSWAFQTELLKYRRKQTQTGSLQVSQKLIEAACDWVSFDNEILTNLEKLLEDPERYPFYTQNRLFKVIDFINQEIIDQKAVLFTSFPETFRNYQKALEAIFSDEGVACFECSMSLMERENNSYKFQTSESCKLLLSDPSGGEGRNLQNASYLVHIDLPWDAGLIEQRIGRLDRLERSQESLDVYSVVPYTEDTLENGLINFWKDGLQIFDASVSGLEMVMETINQEIYKEIQESFGEGLNSETGRINQQIQKIISSIRSEQNFDIASKIFQPDFKRLEIALADYKENENEVLSEIMTSWAEMAGLKPFSAGPGLVRFSARAFSINAAINALLKPPNWNIYRQQEQKKIELGYISPNSVSSEQQIIGTFSRKKAIKSDYIHFFAPGDPVFDSITNNALLSSKATACAVRIPGDFYWKGFIYVWKVEPEEKKLLKAGYSKSVLSPYRKYLYGPLVEVPQAVENPDQISDSKVMKAFHGWINARFQAEEVHLGKRTSEDGLARFKRENPSESWNRIIKQTFEQSKQKVLNTVSKGSNLNGIQSELNWNRSFELTRNRYYDFDTNALDDKELEALIINALKKPQIRLDSAIYLEIVERNEPYDTD